MLYTLLLQVEARMKTSLHGFMKAGLLDYDTKVREQWVGCHPGQVGRKNINYQSEVVRYMVPILGNQCIHACFPLDDGFSSIPPPLVALSRGRGMNQLSLFWNYPTTPRNAI